MESLNQALEFGHFVGSNGAGACTLPNVKVGDQVIGVLQLTTPDDDSADFESTITVDEQIRQSSVSDLSLVDFAVFVVKRSR
jgi:hypothetical protein